MENSKTNYKRFNRHELFTSEDTSLVLEGITRLVGHHSLKNMLYGLFDGYFYNSLREDLNSVVDLDQEIKEQIISLLDKVEIDLLMDKMEQKGII